MQRPRRWTSIDQTTYVLGIIVVIVGRTDGEASSDTGPPLWRRLGPAPPLSLLMTRGLGHVSRCVLAMQSTEMVGAVAVLLCIPTLEFQPRCTEFQSRRRTIVVAFPTTVAANDITAHPQASGKVRGLDRPPKTFSTETTTFGCIVIAPAPSTQPVQAQQQAESDSPSPPETSAPHRSGTPTRRL